MSDIGFKNSMKVNHFDVLHRRQLIKVSALAVGGQHGRISFTSF